jgi:hypothetical protein
MVYRVRTLSTGLSRALNQYSSYIVTDEPDNWNTYEQKWGHVAEFKVSQRHDDETQRRRAIEYCDYMNRGIVIQPPIGVSNGN